MVSVADVEKHKENLAKRAEGYDIRHLLENIGQARVLSSPDTAGETVPETAPCSAHDPLSRDVCELRILQDSMPQKRAFPELVKRMGVCIDRYKEWDMYRNDMRFVSLCLQYGALSESPPMMFHFMESYRIGLRCALFYDRWANYLETTKDTAKAKEVVCRGIKSGAQPVSVLQQLKEDIERRRAPAVKKRAGPSGMQGPAKRPRLGVYRDDSGSDADDEAAGVPEHARMGVPQLITEGKENKQPSEPLVVSSRRALTSIRRLQAYEDDSGEDSEPHNSGPRNLLLPPSLQLLANRTFEQPVRAFESGPRPMRRRLVAKSTVPVKANASLAAAMDQPHQGRTEIIGRLQLTSVGDTENLK